MRDSSICLRTPPDLKWLLNERASIDGAIEAQQDRRNGLGLKLAKLRHQLEIVQRDHDRSTVTISRFTANREALDAAIAMAYEQANPESAGTVRAWAGRYGERGALTAFVRASLQAAAPNSLTMTVLLDPR